LHKEADLEDEFLTDYVLQCINVFAGCFLYRRLLCSVNFSDLLTMSLPSAFSATTAGETSCSHITVKWQTCDSLW